MNKKPAATLQTPAEIRDQWVWDRASELSKEANEFFRRTGGIGEIALFYRPTDDKFDGSITVVPSHINAPLGYINAGLSVRCVFTQDQLKTKYHDAIRSLPVLPREAL